MLKTKIFALSAALLTAFSATSCSLFGAEKYECSISFNDGGKVTVDKKKEEVGKDVKFTVNVENGYKLLFFKVNDVVVDVKNNTFTTTMVENGLNVVAEFYKTVTSSGYETTVHDAYTHIDYKDLEEAVENKCVNAYLVNGQEIKGTIDIENKDMTINLNGHDIINSTDKWVKKESDIESVDLFLLAHCTLNIEGKGRIIYDSFKIDGLYADSMFYMIGTRGAVANYTNLSIGKDVEVIYDYGDIFELGYSNNYGINVNFSGTVTNAMYGNFITSYYSSLLNEFNKNCVPTFNFENARLNLGTNEVELNSYINLTIKNSTIFTEGAAFAMKYGSFEFLNNTFLVSNGGKYEKSYETYVHRYNSQHRGILNFYAEKGKFYGLTNVVIDDSNVFEYASNTNYYKDVMTLLVNDDAYIPDSLKKIENLNCFNYSDFKYKTIFNCKNKYGDFDSSIYFFDLESMKAFDEDTFKKEISSSDTILSCKYYVINDDGTGYRDITDQVIG